MLLTLNIVRLVYHGSTRWRIVVLCRVMCRTHTILCVDLDKAHVLWYETLLVGLTPPAIEAETIALNMHTFAWIEV